MTIFKDQYTFSPYKFVMEHKPEWIKQITPEVSKKIETLKAQLVKEAEYEHEEDLLVPEYMYTCFKRNIEEQGYFSNWTIFKYFYRMFKIKLLQEMIGEWNYTEEDIEMYRYFNTIEIDEKIKTNEKKLKYNSCIEDEGYPVNTPDMHIYCEFDSDNPTDSNVGSMLYSVFFSYKFSILENLKRRAKMNKITYFYNLEKDDIMAPDFYKNLFSKVSRSGRLSNIVKFSIDYIKPNWKKEYEMSMSEKESNKTFYEGLYEFSSINPMYRKLQVEISQLYYQITQDYKNTKEGKELYDRLSDSEKTGLENKTYYLIK